MTIVEKRASPRRVANCRGIIASDQMQSVRECFVADISDGGVRICADWPIPDRFTLTTEDGGTHQCKIVWRLDGEVGAEFVGV